MERCPSHKSNLSLKIWPFQPLSSQFLQNYNKPLVLFDGKKGKNIKISQPTFTPSCRYCSAIYLESDSVILFSPQRSKSFTHHHLQFLIWSCRFPLCISEPSLWDISLVEMIQVTPFWKFLCRFDLHLIVNSCDVCPQSVENTLWSFCTIW